MFFQFNNRFINILIKLLITGVLIWVLYQQIFQKRDIQALWDVFLKTLRNQSPHFLIISIVLMPVNWIFENFKWRVLIKDIEVISFWKSLKAILAGITLSLFTPNRIGEYGGRVLFVKAENNWKTVVATLVGSYSQLLAILSFGVTGFAVFMGQYFDVEIIVQRTVVILSIALVVLMFFCFYNINLIIPLARNIRFLHRFKKINKNISVLKNYNREVLHKALSFAFLRYIIYSIQYYCMLLYFGIDVGILEGFCGIATIFLFQTSIPLPPLMGLVARGSIAIFIWENFTNLEINILAATFFLWILNLVIPAILGLVFIGNVNITNTLGVAKRKMIKQTDQN